MKLGFDLDETVVDLTSEIEKYLEINYGISWPAECFINYGFRDCKFINDETLNEKIVDDLCIIANDADFQHSAAPAYGAREVLQKLKKVGHQIYFISSRPKQNQPKTFRWLRENDIPFDGLRIIGLDEQKGPHGRRLNLDMYVDDLEKHLVSMWNYKKKWRKGLLLMDKPWNRQRMDGSKFKRVHNWKEILRHVGIANR